MFISRETEESIKH